MASQMMEGDNINTRPTQISRAGTIDKLLCKVSRRGFVLLKGPPRSGKTSLLQLTARMVPQQVPMYSKVVYINLLGVTVNASWEVWFEEQTGVSWDSLARRSGVGVVQGPNGPGSSNSSSTEDGLVLLLIDELQCMFDWDPARYSALYGAMRLLKQGVNLNLRILASALYCKSPWHTWGSSQDGIFTSSLEFSREQLVGFFPEEADAPALALTYKEHQELWSKFWEGHPLHPHLFAGNSTTEHTLYHLTAGQVGTITLILDDLKLGIKDLTRTGADLTRTGADHTRTGADLPEAEAAPSEGLVDRLFRDMFKSGAVYSKLQGSGAFLKLEDIGGEAALQWELFDPLLKSVDAVLVGADEDQLSPSAKRLLGNMHSRGLLRMFTSLERSRYSYYSERSRYSFYSPLHLYFYQDQVLKARTTRVSQAGDASSTLHHFLLVCIPRMSSERLRAMMSGGVDGRLLERRLQLEFHAAALSVLPYNFNICPDVGKGISADGIGDFWVSPVGWALELLRDGSDLREHERRFEPGGKYHKVPIAAYAGLDFRSQEAAPVAQPPPQLVPSSYHIIFNSDYSGATVLGGPSVEQVALKLSP